MQKLLTGSFILRYNNIRRQRGGIAQLGERLNGIQEVAGSIPTTSTTEITELRNFAKLFFSCFLKIFLKILQLLVPSDIVLLICILFYFFL